MHIVSIRGVERRFDHTLALQATDLEVAENDFITILGPSGCGKSTLLRIVAGLDVPTTGEVLLDGQRIAGPGADRGMVFQSYTLFPWLTVLDNVCFGLRERGWPRAQQVEVAHGVHRQGGSGRLRAPLSRSSCRAACSSAPRWPARWPTTRACC